MTIKQVILLSILAFLPLAASADDLTPMVKPTVSYVDTTGVMQEVTSISDGEAPLDCTFRANPSNMADHTPAYEWHFRKQGRDGEFLVRYEENTDYRFTESGTFDIVLKVTLTDTGEELDSASIGTITVAISESKLTFPNAFSPNGDEYNEEFKAKEYKSIVEFHAYIFNRWGQKLFDWTDPSKGWDGKHNGNDVKEGVYFLLVKAKGADGRVYNIRKDVNLLRGFTESNSSTTTN